MICKKCGKDLEEDMKFCPNCGEEFQKETKDEIKKEEEIKEESEDKVDDPIKETVSAEKQKKEKKHIFSWIVCVIMGLSTISVTPYSISNILMLLCTLMACPPLVKKFNKKTGNKISRGLRIFIFIILLVIATAIMPGSEKNNKTIQKPQNTTVSTIEKNKNSEAKKPETKKEVKKENSKSEQKNNKKIEKTTDPKTAFKNACKTYNYKKIARNPNKYIDKKMKFTGKVVQVSEGWFNTVTIRLNVTKNKYGFYDDTVYCTYTYKEGESKILEDDIITVWGTCKGDTTYTSVLGASITIPKLEIEYFKIK